MLERRPMMMIEFADVAMSIDGGRVFYAGPDRLSG
jgi:hypothetical protein